MIWSVRGFSRRRFFAAAAAAAFALPEELRWLALARCTHVTRALPAPV